MIDQEGVRDLFNYSHETGVLSWKEGTQGHRSGGAGCYDRQGYVKFTVYNQQYLAHRLVWLYLYGEWPSGVVDHINRNRHDNRQSNLRDVTNSANLHNRPEDSRNTSGCKGLSWTSSRKLWYASITVVRINYYLGYHKEWWDAVCARKSAEQRLLEDVL